MLNLKEKFFHWRFLRSWRPYFIIISLGFLLYSQILSFDLTYLDDNTLLLDNKEIISDFKNIGLIFSSDAFFSETNFYYRPLLNLSFMIDTLLAGDNLFFYFFVNIILHLLTACLVFLLFKKIIKRRSIAFLFSLVFLIHPAISQAVAWLPGRNDTLLAFFSLLAILFFQKFSSSPKFKFLGLYSIFFFFALLTKETALFLPLLVIVYFFTLGKKDVAEKHDKIIVVLTSVFVGVIWYLLRSLAFLQENISFFDAFKSLSDNLSNAVILACKMALPFNLSVLPVPADTSFLLSILVVPLLVVAFVLSKKKDNDRFFFGLAWVLIFLLPPFIISSSAPFILEHRLYLPLIGFLIMISEIDWLKDLNFNRRKDKLIVLGVLIVLAGITFFHSHKFSNRIVFWESAVSDSPHSPLAQKNLGAMYYLEGKLDDALLCYNKALEINPFEAMVNGNIGLIYFEQGDEKKAEEYYLKELTLYPNYDKTLFNLGFLYYKQGKIIEAASLFEKTLLSNPRHQGANLYLQEVLENKNSDKKLE